MARFSTFIFEHWDQDWDISCELMINQRDSDDSRDRLPVTYNLALGSVAIPRARGDWTPICGFQGSMLERT